MNRIALRLILSLALLATVGCQDGCTWGQPKEIKIGDVAAMAEWANVDIPAMLEKAQQGDAQSQYDLGYQYVQGGHVQQDLGQATRWFLEAAEQGHLEGQFRSGMAYAEGYGVDVDQKEAVRWFRAAAEQGSPEAQFNLGLALAEGRAGEADPTEAAIWYRKAGEQSLAQAWLNLGTLYEEGVGVDRDNDEAMRLYIEAAETGVPLGAINAGRLYGEAGDCEQAYLWLKIGANRGQAGVAEEGLEYCGDQLTEAQIASATEQAEQWQPRVLRDALNKVHEEKQSAGD
jgi:TPR repeat protein